MKFRIVQMIHSVEELSRENEGRSKIEYVIQRKNFWGKVERDICYRDRFSENLS